MNPQGMNDRVDPGLAAGNRIQLASYGAKHFQWRVDSGVGCITLNRPDRKNPLTFESYAELRDLFGRMRLATDVNVVVISGAGDNFCSGGDVHEIIGPLLKLKAPELLMFTRMTGDLVKAMRHCPQPIIAAIDGVRWYRRDPGDGLRPGTGTAREASRSVHPRWPGRLRHGRVRDAAAHRRPGPRQRAALHRARAGRRRGPAMGLLQSPGRPGIVAGRRATLGH
jgi:hypothetical protein